ncbi:MAG TPA: pyruvate formate lyase family protein [bacterium]|nr:pyruvate formate lyase family protein [bacterium]
MSAFTDGLAEKYSPLLLDGVLKIASVRARLDKKFRSNIYEDVGNGLEPWNARIMFRTKDNSCVRHVIIAGGRFKSGKGPVDNPDVTFVLKDRAALKRMLMGDSAESMDMLLKNELTFDGNMAVVTRFAYLLERMTAGKERGLNPRHDYLYNSELAPARKPLPMKPGDEVKYLSDPAFSDWTIDDFPRLKTFLHDFFSTRPEMSTERAWLMTDYFKKHGYETAPDGTPLDPELRQAEAYNHLMQQRKPVVHKNQLVAGSTTEKKIGIPVYPDLGGVFIWPELYTMHTRSLNPYLISQEDRRKLNEDIFPYWIHRNMREVARKKAGNPQSMRLDERFVMYFQWKAHSLSHTIPDFETVLGKGLAAVAEEASEHEKKAADGKARNFYKSTRLCLEGVMSYAQRLSEEAARQASAEPDPARKAELTELARICPKVPAGPAETLDEAVNSMWITWVACHMENTNAGLSIGRVDKWLQPYFAADLDQIADGEARKAYIRHAVELIGCFFMCCTDHLPQVADLGNKLFGGSSSDQAITLGGVDEDGSNAVCDMTYIILKIAEMLRLRDPNLNARYHVGVNSEDYLNRLCEVNMLTGSTPSIHGDNAVLAALVNQGFPLEDARDWSATGCVEPTMSGRHYGHTNCMMFSLVAPFEMALYNGYHPLCDEVIGPKTGDVSEFDTFEKFLDAYKTQLTWLAEKSIECNNLFGETHRYVRPTPLLSSIIRGCMDKGKDLIDGGARHNSSGTAMIGLTDVVDSLMAVKKLVYQEKRVDFPTLLDALRKDFAGYETLHARILNKVPKFGSGDPETTAMAEHMINFLYDLYQSHSNYRGGKYTTGFWSMSNHVAFGVLSGALPSGRRKYKPFTPGITPSPGTKDTLLQQIQTIAGLDPVKMPNNIAFNVKVMPDPKDTPEQALNTMAAYAKTYLHSGGMQMQFNVMSTAEMKDAMAHPEKHRNLMVRISGYNAYFVELNKDLQLELIERTEHCLGK